MLEVSRVGVAESDEEIELSLELSIGGSYGKCEKAKQMVGSSCKDDEKVVENVVSRSGFSFCEADSGSGSEAVNPNRKREIQALRRREARRKREEKLRKSAFNFKGINDNVCLEAQAQELHARAEDREMREKESLADNEPARKKEKILVASCLTNETAGDLPNLALQHDQTRNINQSSEKNAAAFSCQQNVGMMQMRGLYPQSQCMASKDGSVYPCRVPCLGPGVVGKEGNGLKEKTMFQPVACGSFRPYLNGNGDINMRHNSGIGCDPGQHSGMNRIVNQKALSNGSLERSSSAISDYRSSSRKGGSISDTGSHSSCLQANERQLSVSATSDALNQPESNGSLNKREAGKDTLRAANSPMKTSLPKERQYSAVDAARNSEPDIKSNAATSKLQHTPSSPLKQTSELLVPSKIQSQNLGKPSLPRLPCVSATGNGPNGKTITGFLYRYTKTEISIVCVCHGSSFSPAEFVEHAGGIDITHPLRHITMIPSSFG